MAKERRIKGVCKKCGTVLQVGIGDDTIEEVRKQLKDRRAYECPGMHVELGRMYDGYDWDFTVFEAEPVMTDAEWVKELQELGSVVIDGGSNTVPKANLKSIHSAKDLEHRGFGYFYNSTHEYDRADSPRGTRFYVERVKHGTKEETCQRE